MNWRRGELLMYAPRPRPGPKPRPFRLMTVSRYLDRIAISLSAICVVHCLAVPLIVAILPIAAISFGGDSHFHALMLWLVVPVSVAGLVMGYRVHGRLSLVALGVAGVLVVAAAATFGHEQWSPLAEVLVSVAGSLLLASAHWMNFVVVRKVHVHHHC
jgi:drug/metabolite transporter (DMT)-like permease